MRKLLFSLFLIPTIANGAEIAIRGVGVDSNKVAKAGDNMTGQLTTASTITVQGSEFSVVGSTLVVKEGRIGVGTVSPANTLHLVGPGDYNSTTSFLKVEDSAGRMTVYGSLDLHREDLDSDAVDTSINRFGYLGGITRFRDFSVRDGKEGAAILFVDGSAASVGIGTIAPAKKLDVSGGAIQVSTATTSVDFMCFVGAVDALPITGYKRGCLAYLTSDPTKLYISTETVVGAYSWLAK